MTQFSVYLGVITKKDVSCDKDIQNRISKASTVGVKLERMWIDKNESLTAKVRLYESTALSLFLHGSESWTAKKEQKNARCYQQK